jgi:hypothetical protein
LQLPRIFLNANKRVWAEIEQKLFKLLAHKLRHNGERLHCPVCNAEFEEKVMLAIHIGKKH